jgi:hypothetical protein
MRRVLSIALMLLGMLNMNAQPPVHPLVGEDVVFEEVDGLVAVEAEFFYKQTNTGLRKWYLTCSGEFPQAGEDPDDPHVAGASNNAYLEILPDTRTTHDDKLIAGENFSAEPGKLAVLHYKVLFHTPGKYYVWARAYSTGTEDNGLHAGVDGRWPGSGQRLQWCEGKHSWRWESKQRTQEVHCGEPYLIFMEIGEPGLHDIQFSMREDGFEFDKFVLTLDRAFTPGDGAGPAVKLKSGTVPPRTTR